VGGEGPISPRIRIDEEVDARNLGVQWETPQLLTVMVRARRAEVEGGGPYALNDKKQQRFGLELRGQSGRTLRRGKVGSPAGAKAQQTLRTGRGAKAPLSQGVAASSN